MQKTTVVGIHLLFGLIPVYKASLDSALDHFTKEARKKGMNRLRITHSDRESGIWYFPPFTWVITPVFYDITVKFSGSLVQAVHQNGCKEYLTVFLLCISDFTRSANWSVPKRSGSSFSMRDLKSCASGSVNFPSRNKLHRVWIATARTASYSDSTILRSVGSIFSP